MLYPPIRRYLSLLLLLLLLLSSVKWHAGVNGKNRLNIILVLKTLLIFMSSLVCFVHVPFPILAQITTLRSCHSAAVQPPSSSSLQLSARVAAAVVADCFDRSLRCSTRLYAATSRCCCYCCSCQVSSDVPYSVRIV